MILGELDVAGRKYDGCHVLDNDKFFCLVGYLDGGWKDPHKYIRRYISDAEGEVHLSTNFEEKLQDPSKIFLSYYNIVDVGKSTEKVEFMGGASIVKIMPPAAYYGLVVRGLSNIVVDPRYRHRAKFGTMIFGHCTDVALNLYGDTADAVAFGTSNPWVLEGVVPNLNAEPYGYNYVPVGERIRSDGKCNVFEFMFFKKFKDDFLHEYELAKNLSSNESGVFNASADCMAYFIDAGTSMVSIAKLKKERDFLKSFPSANDLYNTIRKDQNILKSAPDEDDLSGADNNHETAKAIYFMQQMNETRKKSDFLSIYGAAKALDNEFAFLSNSYQYLIDFLDAMGCKDSEHTCGGSEEHL